MAAVTAMAIGGVASAGMGMIGANQAEKGAKGARNNAANEKRRLEAELQALEDSRQPIINPYDGVTDLSGNLSNPYANLGVATQAAEFQAEQADISLANTLDTIRATGASAGGATALAQAALSSKKQISASIEMQEANNNQLRARGEQNLQATKLSEAKRVQGALMGEAGRIQQADVSGKEFVYSEKERRETEQLNRKQAQITGQAQAAAQARSDQSAAISSTVSAVGNVAGSFMSAKGTELAGG